MAMIDRLNLMLRSEWNALRHGGDDEKETLAEASLELDRLLVEERHLRRRYQDTLDRHHTMEDELTDLRDRGRRRDAAALQKELEALDRHLDTQRLALNNVQADYIALRDTVDNVEARVRSSRLAQAAGPRSSSRRPEAPARPVGDAFDKVAKTFRQFDATEAQIDALEAEAEAMRELNRDLDPLYDDLAERLNTLERSSPPGDDPLTRLRDRMRRG